MKIDRATYVKLILKWRDQRARLAKGVLGITKHARSTFYLSYNV